MKQTQQPRPDRVRRAGLFLLAFALMMPGCASLAEFAAMRSIPVSGPDNPVVDFACIWQQGEGRDERVADLHDSGPCGIGLGALGTRQGGDRQASVVSECLS